MRAPKAVFFMHIDQARNAFAEWCGSGEVLGVASLFHVGAWRSMLCATALAAPAPGSKSANTQTKAPFVGLCGF